MTIRTKLLGTVMLLIMIAFVVGLLGAYGIYEINKYLRSIAEVEVPETWLGDSLSTEVVQLRTYEKEFFLFSEAKNPAKRDEYYKKIRNSFVRIGKVLKNFELSFVEHDPPLKKKITEIGLLLKATEAAFDPLAMELRDGKSFSEVQSLYVKYREKVRKLKKEVFSLKEEILLDVENISNKAFSVQKNLFRILPAVSLAVIIIGMVIGFLVSRRITTSLSSLMTGIKAVGEGRVDVEVDVPTRDELGEIAEVLNETIDRLRGYIQTEEERKQTQQNLMKFLDILGAASEGDFSEKAPVTADVFGSLADAYNLMIDGLTELLLDVRKTAETVGVNSEQMLAIFDRMSEGAEVQMVEVKKASEAVDDSSAATANIGTRAGDAQQIAVKAAEAAKKGGKLVIQTIEGMQLIRVTVQTINKRMKSLSEKLLEIGNISQLISDISSRTNMLAMNASIEAARAGEQGKGFVVIAEEIRALADRSAAATKDITGIIKAIQTEASEVTTALEEETKNVEVQTKISTDTGLAFRDIDAAIKESNRVVSDIYGLSQRQKELTEKVVLAMEEVNRISLQMLKLVDDSKKIADSLSSSSRGLLGSVTRFKLADETGPEMGEADTEEIRA